MPSPLAIGTADGPPLILRPFRSSSVLTGLPVWMPNGPVVKVVSRTVSANSLAARPYLASLPQHRTAYEFGHKNGISTACSRSKRPGVWLGVTHAEIA